MSIIGQDETIIKQKSGVAFMTIGVEYLTTAIYLLQSLHDEATEHVTVKPTCLLW